MTGAGADVIERWRGLWDRHWRQRRWLRAIVGVVGGGSGLLLAFLTAAIGHCSAFGGRCPSTPPPWWEDDVFGGILVGVALATFSIVVAVRPGRRSLLLALGAAVAVSLPVALVVSRAAHAG